MALLIAEEDRANSVTTAGVPRASQLWQVLRRMVNKSDLRDSLGEGGMHHKPAQSVHGQIPVAFSRFYRIVKNRCRAGVPGVKITTPTRNNSELFC